MGRSFWRKPKATSYAACVVSRSASCRLLGQVRGGDDVKADDQQVVAEERR
jgi:hypothetical protein